MFNFAITIANRISVETLLLVLFFVAAVVVAHPVGQPETEAAGEALTGD